MTSSGFLFWRRASSSRAVCTAFSYRNRPYCSWYMPCSGMSWTAWDIASTALFQSRFCENAPPRLYHAEWLSPHFSTARLHAAIAVSNCLAP